MKTQIQTVSSYEQQALDFLNETNTSMTIKYKKYGKHFGNDDQERAIFRITLKNDLHRYGFDFGQSVAAGMQEPTAYDVLACITKYDPYSFEDFCADFGYDVDSRKAEKIYNAVCTEWENISSLFTEDQITLLQEIQ